MAAFDENNFRAFRLHTVVQNIGTDLYRSYLDKRAKDKSFDSLKALLEDPAIKRKLLKSFKGARMYSPYDDTGNLKSDYPEAADIIKLCNLHRRCAVLKKDSVSPHLESWWNGKNCKLVFDTVLQSRRCLRDEPGAACLVLYHVRNNFLPGTHKEEFSLDQKTYDDALEIAIRALEALGESLGVIDEVESKILKAKRDPIDEKQCQEADMQYQREKAGMPLETDEKIMEDLERPIRLAANVQALKNLRGSIESKIDPHDAALFMANKGLQQDVQDSINETKSKTRATQILLDALPRIDNGYYLLLDYFNQGNRGKDLASTLEVVQSRYEKKIQDQVEEFCTNQKVLEKDSAKRDQLLAILQKKFSVEIDVEGYIVEC